MCNLLTDWLDPTWHFGFSQVPTLAPINSDALKIEDEQLRLRTYFPTCKAATFRFEHWPPAVCLCFRPDCRGLRIALRQMVSECFHHFPQNRLSVCGNLNGRVALLHPVLFVSLSLSLSSKYVYPPTTTGICKQTNNNKELQAVRYFHGDLYAMFRHTNLERNLLLLLKKQINAFMVDSIYEFQFALCSTTMWICQKSNIRGFSHNGNYYYYY